MANSKYHSIYASPKWIRVRAFYVANRLLFDGGMCERCRVKRGAEVHHVTPLTDDNITDDEIVYGMRNLIYLCESCHKKAHKELNNA